jgi:CheY-like chemotaxis protein
MSDEQERGPTPGAVLIVEDNLDDLKLMEREFLRLRLNNPVLSVTCGNQFLAYVQGEGDYADRKRFPYPILLMLDLRMSPRDGYDVLRWLRANPKYNTFPVLVVSVVEEQHKITEAYRLGAKTFLRKPITKEALAEALQGLNVLSLPKP